MNSSTSDELLARSINDNINCIGITENAVFPVEKGKENYKPRTLVDETLEYIDPTPNIFTLFVQFNERFFWNVLLPVQVKWSPRMTSCAGICSFHPRNRECVISLSTPLLKLRPRKDLIETLLHEMIHAFLFLTNNNRDRDGHGPEFQKHMKRINSQAGTNITIYHTFHEEVRLYQQHWWKCNGPCQKKPPYFGMVRRAMNRAPGPNDFWWKEHQLTCGGQYIKIKEPEKREPRKKKSDGKGHPSTKSPTTMPTKNSILNWVTKDNSTATSSSTSKGDLQVPKTNTKSTKNTKTTSAPMLETNLNNSMNGFIGLNMKTKNVNSTGNSFQSNQKNSSTELTMVSGGNLKKLGNSTNNVHGWGTGGPGSGSRTVERDSINNSKKSSPSISFSGTLGGSNSGKSKLLDQFYRSPKINKSEDSWSQSIKGTIPNQRVEHSNTGSHLRNDVAVFVDCPCCNASVEESRINHHLDVCLANSSERERNLDNKRKSEPDLPSCNKISRSENSKNINCPLCNCQLSPGNFNEHLEICLGEDATNDSKGSPDDSSCFIIDSQGDASVHNRSSSSVSLQDSPNCCLICNKVLGPSETLSAHLEECVASVFCDDSMNDGVCDIPKDEREDSSDDRYPCPVCMCLVDKLLMNDHVDVCLNQSD